MKRRICLHFFPEVWMAGQTGPEPADTARPPQRDAEQKQLRRDAERNRQRILKAAAQVFTERGLGVSLDEIARHAGVGVGTVYRRFGTKDELIQALFMDRVEAVAALAEQAAEAPDPWSGLVGFMEQMAEMLAGDLGLRQMMMLAGYGQDHAAYARQRNAPLVTRLVERAQAAGQLRPDLGPTDIPILVFLLTEAAHLARPVNAELWRRYLTLFTDGMRPRRDGVSPLPVSALLPEEMEKAMREHAAPGR
jgi:AcrR family transcriptional regulator